MNIWNTMEKSKIYGDGRHSAATSLPCLASLGHLTADKREIKDFLKLPLATSFICKPLYAIAVRLRIRS